MTASSAPVDANAPTQLCAPVKRRWQILAGLCMGLSVCYAQRTNLSVAAVAMAEDLDWTDSEKNTALSAFFWGYCAFMLPGGWLVRRFGGFAMFGASVLVSTLLTAAIPFAAHTSVGFVYFLRAVTGAVEAATFPAIYALLSTWVPEAEKGRSVSFVFGAEQIGSMLGFSITGSLVHRVSWESSFYFFAAFGAVTSGFWFVFCSGDPKRDRYISPAERAEILQGKCGGSGGSGDGGAGAGASAEDAKASSSSSGGVRLGGSASVRARHRSRERGATGSKNPLLEESLLEGGRGDHDHEWEPGQDPEGYAPPPANGSEGVDHGQANPTQSSSASSSSSSSQSVSVANRGGDSSSSSSSSGGGGSSTMTVPSPPLS